MPAGIINEKASDMWMLIKAFFASNMARIIQWLGIALAALGVVASIYRSGGKAERVKQLEEDLKSGRESNEIRDKNRSELGDGDAARRLRDEWSR